MIRFFFVLLFSVSAWGQVELPAEALKFRYQPDSFPGTECKHQRVRNLPDWTVRCKDKYHNKEYSVHLVLNKSLSKDGRTRYEVLYWVTDRVSPRQRLHHGTSMKFIFKGDASGEIIDIGQMVDKGVAHLGVEIRL